MKKIRLVLPLFLLTLLPANILAQSFRLAEVFGDHMVLQQNEKVPIWGWAFPGEKIDIVPSWGDTVKIQAKNSGKWKAEIQTPAASYTPHSLTIIGNSKSDIIYVQNILIGEVWLASGQSNMEWPNQWLRVDNYEREVGAANLPNLRFFKVYLKTSELPQDDLSGEWNVCNPEVMQNTSGTGYYFAKHLQKVLDVPVGVIVDAWGGTPIEFWYAPEAEAEQKDLVESTVKMQSNMWWPASQPGWGYNAMTYPLGNYAIAGMIWYQGESNATEPYTYAKKTEVLVKERRKQFGHDFPFYWVQIAPYKYSPNQEHSGWIRDQQRLALDIPNTGMVVTSDIGDTLNIHPSNKNDVGNRLANLALKNHYQAIEGLVESPVFESAKLVKGKVQVNFIHGDGLNFSEAERGYFEVAGVDKVFHSVKAVVKDGKVLLDTRKIDQPQQVQFAFSNTATPVLFNRAGLPASCFGPQKIL